MVRHQAFSIFCLFFFLAGNFAHAAGIHLGGQPTPTPTISPYETTVGVSGGETPRTQFTRFSGLAALVPAGEQAGLEPALNTISNSVNPTAEELRAAVAKFKDVGYEQLLAELRKGNLSADRIKLIEKAVAESLATEAGVGDKSEEVARDLADIRAGRNVSAAVTRLRTSATPDGARTILDGLSSKKGTPPAAVATARQENTRQQVNALLAARSVNVPGLGDALARLASPDPAVHTAAATDAVRIAGSSKVLTDLLKDQEFVKSLGLDPAGITALETIVNDPNATLEIFAQKAGIPDFSELDESVRIEAGDLFRQFRDNGNTQALFRLAAVLGAARFNALKPALLNPPGGSPPEGASEVATQALAQQTNAETTQTDALIKTLKIAGDDQDARDAVAALVGARKASDKAAALDTLVQALGAADAEALLRKNLPVTVTGGELDAAVAKQKIAESVFRKAVGIEGDGPLNADQKKQARALARALSLPPEKRKLAIQQLDPALIAGLSRLKKDAVKGSENLVEAVAAEAGAVNEATVARNEKAKTFRGELKTDAAKAAFDALKADGTGASHVKAFLTLGGTAKFANADAAIAAMGIDPSSKGAAAIRAVYTAGGKKFSQIIASAETTANTSESDLSPDQAAELARFRAFEKDFDTVWGALRFAKVGKLDEMKRLAAAFDAEPGEASTRAVAKFALQSLSAMTPADRAKALAILKQFDGKGGVGGLLFDLMSGRKNDNPVVADEIRIEQDRVIRYRDLYRRALAGHVDAIIEINEKYPGLALFAAGHGDSRLLGIASFRVENGKLIAPSGDAPLFFALKRSALASGKELALAEGVALKGDGVLAVNGQDLRGFVQDFKKSFDAAQDSFSLASGIAGEGKNPNIPVGLAFTSTGTEPAEIPIISYNPSAKGRFVGGGRLLPPAAGPPEPQPKMAEGTLPTAAREPSVEARLVAVRAITPTTTFKGNLGQTLGEIEGITPANAAYTLVIDMFPDNDKDPINEVEIIDETDPTKKKKVKPTKSTAEVARIQLALAGMPATNVVRVNGKFDFAALDAAYDSIVARTGQAPRLALYGHGSPSGGFHMGNTGEMTLGSQAYRDYQGWTRRRAGDFASCDYYQCFALGNAQNKAMVEGTAPFFPKTTASFKETWWHGAVSVTSYPNDPYRRSVETFMSVRVGAEDLRGYYSPVVAKPRQPASIR